MRRHVLTLLLLGATLTGMVFLHAFQRERGFDRLVAEGDAALAQGDLAGAIEAFSGAVTLKPDAMVAYLKRGDAYRRRGEADLGLALRDLRRASVLDPTAAGPLEGLGDVYLARVQPGRAVDSYRSALAVDERSARVQYKLALALYESDRLDEAQRTLATTLQLDPRLAEAHYLRGLCYSRRHQWQDAHRSLQQALALTPSLIPAREEMSAVCRALGRQTEELSHLEALLALDPTRVEQYLGMGAAYARAGQTDRAISTLSQAATRFPEDSRVYVTLGRVWLEQAIANGDRVALSKGLEAWQQAGGLADEDSAMLTLIGSAYLRMREPRRALRYFDQATQVLPVDPSAHRQLAETAERLGLWSAAYDAQRKANVLAADSDTPPGRARLIKLGDLSLKMGDASAAHDWYQRARTSGASDAQLGSRLASATQAISKDQRLQDQQDQQDR